MGEITSLISTIFDEPGNPNIGLFIAAIMFVFLAHLISQFINYHFDTDWQKNLIAEVELIKKLDEINFDDSNKTDCKEKLLTHIIEEVNRKTILMQSKIDRINRFPLAYRSRPDLWCKRSHGSNPGIAKVPIAGTSRMLPLRWESVN